MRAEAVGHVDHHPDIGVFELSVRPEPVKAPDDPRGQNVIKRPHGKGLRARFLPVVGVHGPGREAVPAEVAGIEILVGVEDHHDPPLGAAVQDGPEALQIGLVIQPGLGLHPLPGEDQADRVHTPVGELVEAGHILEGEKGRDLGPASHIDPPEDDGPIEWVADPLSVGAETVEGFGVVGIGRTRRAAVRVAPESEKAREESYGEESMDKKGRHPDHFMALSDGAL